ncbi:MAG: type I pullulanase [Clostridium sp.]
MKKRFLSFIENEIFKDRYYYQGELGCIYSLEETIFRVWSPLAEKGYIILYKDEKLLEIPLEKKSHGILESIVKGDLNGVYYNYRIVFKRDNGDLIEKIATDPYVKAVGINGNRGMVIDLSKTNPKGWEYDKKPIINSAVDSIIYEIHIRDFTISNDSGVAEESKGKYNGLSIRGTAVPNKNIKTCLDHLIELGVNTIHILPSFDFSSIDESKPNTTYNWGYDPQNYNVPEGSYSGNPYEGKERIREFKEMVLNFHNNGIRVVMDVVYNHTYSGEDSNLNKIFPYYYYRQTIDGNFSNGSGCGNEIATERPMVRKMIVDSVIYWAKEYHIDGFRFDLMGLIDIETIKEIRKKLDHIDKSIIIYGEGWRGGSSPLPDNKSVLKSNIQLLGKLQIAAFSDDIRDGIKGEVFNPKGNGFINGKFGLEETIKFGIVGATYHKDVDYSKVLYSNSAWAKEPYQNINYTSAHDNYTLWDKLQLVNERANKEELIEMNKLAAAIILTSQGIAFIHAGEDFARTKKNVDGTFNENSYNASDYVNEIRWDRKELYLELFQYYKGLIELRNTMKCFRMRSSDEIRKNIQFLRSVPNNVIAYVIAGDANMGKRVVVIFNSNEFSVKVDIPLNKWKVIVDGKKSGIDEISRGNRNFILVDKKCSMVIIEI